MSSKEELLKRLSDGVVDMEEDDVAEAAQEYLDEGYPAFDGIMEGLVDGIKICIFLLCRLDKSC